MPPQTADNSQPLKIPSDYDASAALCWQNGLFRGFYRNFALQNDIQYCT